MTTRISPLAGQPAPVCVAGRHRPARHRVLHGSARSVRAGASASPSAPRAIAARRSTLSFNERHVLAITQAICAYRQRQGIDGPLFLGIDTHALSAPACASALEVLAANGVETMLATNDEYTPTPAISHAILAYNRGRTSAPGRRHRRHALAQPARQRRLQVQPAERRPGGHRDHRRDRGGSQRLARAVDAGRQAHRPRRGAARADDASARLPRQLRRRPRPASSTSTRSAGPRCAWASTRSAAPACTTGPASPSTIGST